MLAFNEIATDERENYRGLIKAKSVNSALQPWDREFEPPQVHQLTP